MDYSKKRKLEYRGGAADVEPPKKVLEIPISLGRPSLRRRLEDYYSLIAPDVISNESEWRRKFELIYEKYGGSIEKESALSRKLAKKYGNTVRLKLTVDDEQRKAHKPNSVNRGKVNDEKYYELSELQKGSGIISFTSEGFDPFAVLLAKSSDVYAANSFAQNAPLLNNVDQFRVMLPPCDPCWRQAVQKSHVRKEASTDSTENMRNKIPVFTSLAARYENAGPLSFLHSVHVKRQRIRVMHWNLLLRDVDEVYTSRITKVLEDEALSKAELELKRRTSIQNICRKKSYDVGQQTIRKKRTDATVNEINGVKVGQRHMHQILVRGDNIVSIWRADDEKTQSLG
ncbi:hypothetical protein CTEN210_17426 [Chaetoceros tenuissimus]|uniref:Uncharacterized protein n=1 Tax=Chaetoceros tenuissimus TaxID=426638 RepID=A0AAD3HES0_9STRA|nr:hypothetical protein CTEN210_17426 [Chaetoceros tenuissimus]